MPKFCPKCGAQARDTATTCPVCDAPFDAVEINEEIETLDETPLEVEQPKEPKVETKVIKPNMGLTPAQGSSQGNNVNSQEEKKPEPKKEPKAKKNSNEVDKNSMSSLNAGSQHEMPKEDPVTSELTYDDEGNPMLKSVDYKPDIAMCILCYLGILALVPYLTKKDDLFLQFHSKQGLNLAIVSFGASVVLSILAYIPVINILSALVGLLFAVCVLGFSVMGILAAVNGEMRKLPFIDKYTIIK